MASQLNPHNFTLHAPHQVVYCASVGSYFKGGQLTPIDLVVETHFHRSAPGGMGGTKCAGNYSPVLVTQVLELVCLSQCAG